MKKRNILRLRAIACAASFAVAPLGAQAADPVAKVNGKEIPQSRMDFVIKANAGQGQADSPDLRNRVREALIRNELLAQEAAKKGLDKTPEYITQVDIGKQEALVNAYVQDYVKNNPITDDAIKAEYERANRRPATRNSKRAIFSSKTRTRRNKSSRRSRKAAASKKLPRKNPKIRAQRPRAAIWTGRPAVAMCRPLAMRSGS